MSIGCGEYQSTHYLTDCIAAFKEMYPRVTYEFYSGNAKNIYDNIERGLLDVGLMSELFDIQKFNFISMPTEEQWGLLVEKILLANKESIQLRFSRSSLILPDGNFQSNRVRKWLGEYSNQIQVIAIGNLQYNEVLLTESHVGAVVGIKLKYSYENIVFIPFSLDQHMVQH
ncbi:MAG: LysR family transcriptional regulator substrate-binding protein [Coprobacillus cateniformis]